MPERCPWCLGHPLYLDYHDQEWGTPLHDDQKLFEFLILETFQAGLSWLTVLRKRERFREVFARFDSEAVARFTRDDENRLLADPGIIRNRLKVASAVTNAKAFLEVQAEFGSFDAYIWGFQNGVPAVNQWRTLAEVPASTPMAETISRDLRSRGFRFVGPTVVYAHMQATGMVNDHLVGCFRHSELR